MNEAGDKRVTTQEATQETAQEPRARKGSKNGGPHTKVKFGSACVPVYLSQANGRTRYFLSYLPEERATASDQVKVVRVKGGDVSVFTPKEMAKILHAAPPDLIPILAIGRSPASAWPNSTRLDCHRPAWSW